MLRFFAQNSMHFKWNFSALFWTKKGKSKCQAYFKCAALWSKLENVSSQLDAFAKKNCKEKHNCKYWVQSKFAPFFLHRLATGGRNSLTPPEGAMCYLQSSEHKKNTIPILYFSYSVLEVLVRQLFAKNYSHFSFLR